MKKITTLIAIMAGGMMSATAMAETFTGPSVGLQVNAEKFSSDTEADVKRFASFDLIADYGFAFGNDFVGLVQASAQLGSSGKIYHFEEDGNSLKRKRSLRIGYAQGYHVLPNLLPYVKVNYDFAKAAWTNEESFRIKGFGYGLGAKYAVTKNIELGAEYTRQRYTDGYDAAYANRFSFSTAYRF